MITNLLVGKIKLDLFTKILAVCVIVLLASLLGFLLETIWVALRHGFIDNRGMHMPFLLGYGLANLAVFWLFGSPGKPRGILHSLLLSKTNIDVTDFYYIEIFLFVSVCEALMGYAVHYICGMEWWNYNSIPLHIGQYTSIPTSIGFTACMSVFLEYFFVPMFNYLTSIDLMKYAGIILFISVLAVIDCVRALIYMAKNKHTYTAFHIELKNEPLLGKFAR